MRGRQRLVATFTGMLCVLGCISLPARHASAATYEVSDPVPHVIETAHGSIYLEVVHPVREGKVVAAPAIVTYSPYSVVVRQPDAERWVSRGYARVWADVLGTGNSGGCWDYGGPREQRTGADLVEWVGSQPWSAGRVAMIGGSYDGTTALAAATKRPKHLKTVVPEAAVARWYDYSYAGGIRYVHGNEYLSHRGAAALGDHALTTPATFDFGLAIPPPLDVGGQAWADRMRSTTTPCDELVHTERGYDDTPDYDAFWRARDPLAAAGVIDVPVLIGANWGDWDVKPDQSWKLFGALRKAPKKVLVMGSRWDGHTRPGGDYPRIVEAWMDRYLKGVRNGADALPSVITQPASAGERRDFVRGRPATSEVVLYAQQAPPTGGYLWQLLPSRPRPAPGPEQALPSFPSAGINTESHALHHARNNHDWFWFETPPLRRDVRIFGEIKVQVWLEVDREWVTLTPTIADVDPADHVMVGAQHVGASDTGALVGVTRGWLDSRYRAGLDRQVPAPDGGSFGLTVAAKPTDYIFEAGHVIGLSVQTEINEWSLPKPYACASAGCPLVGIDWTKAKTRLVLPVVNAPANPASLFAFGHHH